MNSQEHSAALQAIARQAMVKYGLDPDWPPEVRVELSKLAEVPSTAPRDLRALPWSSIDNDDSRDLDQLEACIEGPSPRLLIAIADVDALVRKGSALDAHAETNTTSVGQEFEAVVTGASNKGIWVRLRVPPVEGRLERGAQGLDVGDRVRVRLIGTDPGQGFIDFARV